MIRIFFLSMLFLGSCVSMLSPMLEPVIVDSKMYCHRYENTDDQKACEQAMEDGIQDWKDEEKHRIQEDAYDFGRTYGPQYQF